MKKTLIGLVTAMAVFVTSTLASAMPVEKAPQARDAVSFQVMHAPPIAVEAAPERPFNIVTLTVTPSGCFDVLCAKRYVQHNARTDAGAQSIAQMIGQAAGTPFNYIALSSDVACAGSPCATAKSDVACPSEITGSGLARKQGTYGTYTAPSVLGGAASYQLTATWTATAGATVTKLCAMNASSGGTLGYETVLSSPVVLNSGDSAALTWTWNV